MPHTVTKPLDADGGGGSEENTERARDMRLAFEEQEKSTSATASSSPRPYRSTEPLHPQIDQEEHDQGGSNYGGLKELR